jgi:phosphate transport system protein
MSHYEERLERDLVRIRKDVASMAERVMEGLNNAIHALLTGDHKLAAATILADHPVNRAMREIDRLCHAFIALHLPSAGHLRLLSAVIRANIALERIGDYAVTIARVSEQLAAPPEGQIAVELERFGSEAQRMLKQAVTAFNELNADVARATMVMERDMEYDLDAIYAELMSNREPEKVRNILAVFILFTHLKRVADQAKNLCEETVFAVTGQTKAPKVYNILFVDEHNCCLSPMAEAIARKNFPESGHYNSAGSHPSAALNPALVRFMGEHGVDLSGVRPRALKLTHYELAEKHLVISLQGPVRNYVPELPFHTTGLEWDVGPIWDDRVETLTSEEMQTIYRQIAAQVSDLMELLRGRDAR